MFVGVVGVTRSIMDTVGEHRSMMSWSVTDKDVVVVVAGNRIGVVGVVPIDAVLGGVRGIVPNEVIFTGVIGLVPVETIVFVPELSRIIAGCCSTMLSIRR